MIRTTVPILILLACLPCNGQNLPTYELTEFTVVAPNLRMPVTKLHEEAMRSAKPMDLAAILSAKLPAAALSRKSPLAGDLVLRGLSRDNILITVDNNKTFCACPNRMDPPAFHVSSQQIESVEVRTGPFSVDRGASIGGRVAVETKSPQSEDEVEAYAYFGSFDYLAGGVSGGWQLSEDHRFSGGLHHQRGGVFEDGDGVPFTELAGTNYLDDHSGKDAFRVTTLEAKLDYDIDAETNLHLSFGYQDASDVLYPGLKMDAPKDRMHRGSIRLQKESKAAWADRWEAGIALSRVDHEMDDALRLSSNKAPSGRDYFMLTEAQSGYTGLYLEAFKELREEAALSYGADLQRRTWNADNIIGMLENDMLPDVRADLLGFWTVYERTKGAWAMEVGARLDWARSRAEDPLTHIETVRGTDTNRQDDLMPSVYAMLSRDMSESLNLYTGLGYATRPPDPQERYMNLNKPDMIPPGKTAPPPDWVGNPDLKPVHNLEWQSGFSWQAHEDLSLKGSAFYAWLDDLVYLEKLTNPSTATSYTNIDARLYGFSLDGDWALNENLSLQAGLAWQRGEKTSRPQQSTNDVLGEIPPLKGRLSAEWADEKWAFATELLFQDSYDRIDESIDEKAISGWAVVNLVASYQWNEQLSLNFGVDNLFDKRYAVANAFVRDPFNSGIVVNEPGRFVYLRVATSF